jgi:hypothetical protein
MAQKNRAFGAVGKVSHKRAIDLDNVDRQRLQVPQRGVPGAEIVKRDPATRLTQRVNEPDCLFDVKESRGLGDFDDQPAAEVRPVTQARHQ